MLCVHPHTRTSLSRAQEWAPSAPEPTGRIFFAWEWGHLLCSVVPVVAKSRLVLERDGLLHMPRWELVVMHVLSLLSNLIIWHIRYEPRFFFRCGLEESANSCTCATRGTKNASFCRSSAHTVFVWAKRNRTRSCCFSPVRHYTTTAMSVVLVHIQFCIPITLLILVPI